MAYGQTNKVLRICKYELKIGFTYCFMSLNPCNNHKSTPSPPKRNKCGDWCQMSQSAMRHKTIQFGIWTNSIVLGNFTKDINGVKKILRIIS